MAVVDHHRTYTDNEEDTIQYNGVNQYIDIYVHSFRYNDLLWQRLEAALMDGYNRYNCEFVILAKLQHGQTGQDGILLP